jgi:hypothetical protein
LFSYTLNDAQWVRLLQSPTGQIRLESI